MAYVYLKSTDSLMTSQQDGGIIITSLAGSGTISWRDEELQSTATKYLLKVELWLEQSVMEAAQ